MYRCKMLAVALVTLAFSGLAESDGIDGFNFTPLDASANSADWKPASPWKVPKGFKQRVVSDETDLNIYDGGRNDWHDMNTVNETGPEKGRYLYRTHELRNPNSQPEGGSVSVVDLKTGETRILVQDSGYDALDGIRWTPWGTILFAEEITDGRLFEIFLEDDRMTAKRVVDRAAVGRIAHEGIDLDPDGNLYVIDEHHGRTSGCNGDVPCGGGVYKFVPDVAGDLSAGALYALKVNGRDGVGQGEWVGPIDPLNVRESGSAAGGQSYQRPEDLEIIGDTLYVAITEGPRDTKVDRRGRLVFTSELYEGRVIAIDLHTLQVTNFVKPGVNAPVEIGKPGEEGHQSGFDSVDNLAEAPNGDLVMIEDNNPSDIWFASQVTNAFGASRSVTLFASLTDPGAEGTGIYFSPEDPDTLYVNVQHSAADDGDGTWAISREERKGK
ncbi:MAG: PhoX family protein [Candidatus Thiodiazotropha sp. (ex Lucina aurantia)]|uniref:Phosphatase n=1 Tax=Candidatus Thiodiazotropha endolucinida TaxID=1655433 RepID=A0A7Z1ADU4_9GAMM|nr:alkaline phosphatase PhoX [Candidatus Thiodiazotropha endolucinida]MBT3040976.1 PhoX family protein [Candidatus Thiodiazotropha sp. (ex Codakia orbicularis)]MBV2104387.1 PhoX family protein [Candidatus Thiodiazotropha sp. (ex Lucina aurantia)]MBV2125777.1 PhoX family protein [Candidatus Thiodiazotropha taylori]MBV2099548.1 PhoX family protein [Candidatus Thiodiazotropha sp. (ex Codakia orbicularis)]MBV2118831.1 PhoX family protein [Candidatus Thiodiazotropha sp. (ex Lucina aurantia)]